DAVERRQVEDLPAGEDGCVAVAAPRAAETDAAAFVGRAAEQLRDVVGVARPQHARPTVVRLAPPREDVELSLHLSPPSAPGRSFEPMAAPGSCIDQSRSVLR